MLLPYTNPVEWPALTQEMKAAVPTLEGLDEVPGGVNVRRLSGVFTVAEVTALQTTLAAHNASAIVAARTARETAKRNAILALKTWANGPPQPVTRTQLVQVLRAIELL